ncbi:helix-turn-helix domain-containing protein [Psychromarinibacter sp. S121]|uniref:helix-turn-helix domain-containing protein n=1 Tax=Psychromarinibacter sp. S121 TaxID=3415127 RepID=UPI003C7A8ACD
MITGAQIRMARGYAKLSVKDLADASGVASSTIKRMEAADGVPASSGANLDKVLRALEEQGIQFLDDGDIAGGPGVAMRMSEV